DRVGRSLIDLLHTIQLLEAANVDLYLDRQNIDTTTPMGKLIFQITGAFAEFERNMIQQRIHAGLARARKHGTKSGAPIGRAPIDPALERLARAALAKGASYRAAAEAAGVSLGTVQRIAAEMRPFGGDAEPAAAGTGSGVGRGTKRRRRRLAPPRRPMPDHRPTDPPPRNPDHRA